METFEQLQVHYYWWTSPSIINHNGYCSIGFVFLFPSAWFFSLHVLWSIFFQILHYFQHVFFFFFNYYLVAFPPSVSCRLTEKAAFLMSVTASPLHHQCLTLTLALIFSQLPHPECWMPRLPLEAPRLLLACFACLVPGARLGLVSMWWRCLCPDALVLFEFTQPLTAEVRYCGHLAVAAGFPQSFSFSLLMWLKPSWYSAHRLIL